MKRTFPALAVAALLSVSSAPLAAQPFQLYDGVDAVRTIAPAGDAFPGQLAAEYRQLALYEADDMVDWVDAERFAQKTLASARGEMVDPERPEDWSVGEMHLPALHSARARLLRAFDRDSRIIAPHASARAQAQFDCWVEQAEEGHQGAHIARCREEFLNAMLEIDKVLAIYELERIEREYPAK